MKAVIADDDLITRRGLAAVLAEDGCDVVAQASDADEAIAAVAAHRPDVAILDIRMPPTHTTEGLAAARLIRDEVPDTAVLVLSHHLEPSYALELIERSPSRTGYLLKERIVEDAVLADAVGRVVAGECVVDAAIVERVFRSQRARDPLDRLTPREREVLALVAEGRSNGAIARTLSVAERTVESHTAQIFMKLGIDDEPIVNRRVVAVLTFLHAGPR